jgi:hypothetical protein
MSVLKSSWTVGRLGCWKMRSGSVNYITVGKTTLAQQLIVNQECFDTKFQSTKP